MSILKRVVIMLILAAFCLGLAGCMRSEFEDEAVVDIEILKETDTTDEEKPSSAPIDKEEAKQLAEEQPSKPVEEPKQPAEDKKEQSAEEESAPVKKQRIASYSTNAAYNKEKLLEKGDLVLKVRLGSKVAEEMVNPDGKAKDAAGNLINNRLVTSYNAEVLEVYKGDYSKKSIIVKTSEGYGLSADLILHGEDEKFILATPLRRFLPETGKEYLLVLVSVKGENKVASGYFIFGPEVGLFSLNENDEWVNTKIMTNVSFDNKNVKNEIDSVINKESVS